jgi:hypothetical protein
MLDTGWLTLTVLIFAAVTPATAEPKRVLLLHSFGPQFVPWVFFAAQFREEPFKQSIDKIDLYEASLEAARFQQPDAVMPRRHQQRTTKNANAYQFTARSFCQRRIPLRYQLG